MALILIAGSGCTWTDKNPWGETAKCHLPPGSTESEVIQAVNARTQRITAWRANRAKIKYAGPDVKVPITLDAFVLCEAPRHFVLNASSLLGSEVQLGSNDERFWFWARRSQHQKVLTASHEDLDVAQHQLPIPFQPEWVLEAMGVIPIDETNAHVEDAPAQPGQPRRVWIVTDCTSPQGEPVKKVVLVNACHGIPIKHELIDPKTNKVIASASLMAWHEDPKTKEPVPGIIELKWPAAGMTITMDLNRVDVNPAFTDRTWEMPTFEQPILDLGRVAQADGARPHHDVDGGE